MVTVPEDRPLSEQQKTDLKAALAAEIAAADPGNVDPIYQAVCQWSCFKALLALLE